MTESNLARPAELGASSSPPDSRGTGPFISARYRKQFEGDGSEFSAYGECVAWLKAREFWAGPMQDHSPIGVMYGEMVISKWRNLSPEERADLHGQIIAVGSSFRSGPVVLVIRSDAPSEVIEAFLSEPGDVQARNKIEGHKP